MSQAIKDGMRPAARLAMRPAARLGVVLVVTLLFVGMLAGSALGNDAVGRVSQQPDAASGSSALVAGSQLYDADARLSAQVASRYGVSPSYLVSVAVTSILPQIEGNPNLNVNTYCYDPVYNPQEYGLVELSEESFGKPLLWILNINFTVDLTATTDSAGDVVAHIACYQEKWDSSINTDTFRTGQGAEPAPGDKKTTVTYEDYMKPKPVVCFELGGAPTDHIETSVVTRTVTLKNGEVVTRRMGMAVFPGNVYLWCPFSIIGTSDNSVPSGRGGAMFASAATRESAVALFSAGIEARITSDPMLLERMDARIREIFSPSVNEILKDYELNAIPPDILDALDLEIEFPALFRSFADESFLSLPENFPGMFDQDTIRTMLNGLLVNPAFDPSALAIDPASLGDLAGNWMGEGAFMIDPGSGLNLLPPRPDGGWVWENRLRDASNLQIGTPTLDSPPEPVDLLQNGIELYANQIANRIADYHGMLVASGRETYDNLIAVSAVSAVSTNFSNGSAGLGGPLLEYLPLCAQGELCAMGYRHGITRTEGGAFIPYQQILYGAPDFFAHYAPVSATAASCTATPGMRISEIGAEYASEACSFSVPNLPTASPLYVIADLGRSASAVNASSLCMAAGGDWFTRFKSYYFGSNGTVALPQVCSGDNVKSTGVLTQTSESTAPVIGEIRFHVGPASVYFGYDSFSGAIFKGTLDYIWFDPDQGSGT